VPEEGITALFDAATIQPAELVQQHVH